MSENLSYYCIKECVIGSPVAKKFLEEADSVWDSVFDTHHFICECQKTCKYKAERENYDLKETTKC